MLSNDTNGSQNKAVVWADLGSPLNGWFLLTFHEVGSWH
jgi:hypothetical protein